MDEKKVITQNANIRLVFLLSFFANSIGDAFNVVYLRQMATRLTDGKSEFYVSMAVTGMSAMMVLGVILSGVIVRKIKDFTSYIKFGIIISMAGMCIRTVAQGYFYFLPGFFLSGFGLGLLFIGIRYYAFLYESSKVRMSALINTNGGAFAGQCMGIILGGIMANQIPYRYIYLFSVVIFIFPLIMISKIKIVQKVNVGTYRQIFNVLKNPEAVFFSIFIVLPIYAASVFVAYVVPLDVDDFGFSATVISVLMLVNYLLAAYVAPVATALVTRKMSSLKATVFYMICTAILIILYSIFHSMVLLVITVIVCGLLDAFGLTTVMVAYTKTKNDDTYTDSDSLIIFILVSRLGQTIGPSMILSVGNISILGVMLMFGVVVYTILKKTNINSVGESSD